MDNAIVHHRRLVVLTLAVVLALAMVVVLPKASSAAPEPNDNAPVPADATLTLEEICDFPVLLEATGKSKFIELPGARAIQTSPGLRLTLTNTEDPANQVTFVATGAFHQRELANGSLAVVATGRNLLFDPSFGMFFTIGRFTFVVDEQDNLTLPTGKGRLIDVCARLA
jgi:hypothetical protein